MKDAINSIVKEKDRIDVVVNNAGYHLMGAIEETSMEELRDNLKPTFLVGSGTMQSVIPIMRKQGEGIIVNITSLGEEYLFH